MKNRFFPWWIRFLLFLGFLLGAAVGGGCNDYPLQAYTHQTIKLVTDVQSQLNFSQVDILFVVDNSGSMKEEQEKLARNFKTFINTLMTQQVNDFHIGVITTDMDNCTRDCGKLRGSPKILDKKMSARKIVEAFARNVQVGTDGSSYEKGLEALRAALSPTLLNDPNANKGFLRPDALLVVIFITDEDDCSHNGTIKETAYHPAVCDLPASAIVTNEQGEPYHDENGQPLHGMMERRLPVSRYIDFLRSLKRKVLVAGMIGDPLVFKTLPGKPQSRQPIDPPGGCRFDRECQSGASPHRCAYLSPQKRQCGGCNSTDANASPGFRYHELIKTFGGEKSWAPICSNDSDFVAALLHFANLIVDTIDTIGLTQTPQTPQAISVQILPSSGPPIEVPLAPSLPPATPCDKDHPCASGSVCGADSQCYGDGWVYFPPRPDNKIASIKLSGRFRQLLLPGSRVKINYLAR